jgi:hypothetical protein
MERRTTGGGSRAADEARFAWARPVLDQDDPSAIATLEALRERSLLHAVAADGAGGGRAARDLA